MVALSFLVFKSQSDGNHGSKPCQSICHTPAVDTTVIIEPSSKKSKKEFKINRIGSTLKSLAHKPVSSHCWPNHGVNNAYHDFSVWISVNVLWNCW
jgi:hypothetical protein